VTFSSSTSHGKHLLFGMAFPPLGNRFVSLADDPFFLSAMVEMRTDPSEHPMTVIPFFFSSPRASTSFPNEGKKPASVGQTLPNSIQDSFGVFKGTLTARFFGLTLRPRNFFFKPLLARCWILYAEGVVPYHKVVAWFQAHCYFLDLTIRPSSPFFSTVPARRPTFRPASPSPQSRRPPPPPTPQPPQPPTTPLP